MNTVYIYILNTICYIHRIRGIISAYWLNDNLPRLLGSMTKTWVTSTTETGDVQPKEGEIENDLNRLGLFFNDHPDVGTWEEASCKHGAIGKS